MPTTPASSQPWTQMGLFPPEVLELTLRVGIVLGTDHGQLQLEIRNAETEELYALDSSPHVEFCDMESRLHDYSRTLTEWVRLHTGPFTHP